jgi:hypothetical protein
MKEEEFDAIRTEVSRLRARKINTQFGLAPASIPNLDGLMEECPVNDGCDRSTLYSLLLGECSRAMNDEMYIYFLKRRCAEDEADVLALTNLGSVLSVIGGDKSDEALIAAEKAVRMAKDQNRFVRHCATNLARAALRLNNYDYLIIALRTLLDDAENFREQDTTFAFDFIDGIDLKRCDAELIDQYKKLAQVHRSSREHNG